MEKKTRDNQMIENDVSQSREGQHAATCLKILREKKRWMVCFLLVLIRNTLI